ncbi:MAG TPA: hypothetical protein VGG00_02980, partial [Rhodanobacter sp.]
MLVRLRQHAHHAHRVGLIAQYQGIVVACILPQHFGDYRGRAGRIALTRLQLGQPVARRDEIYMELQGIFMGANGSFMRCPTASALHGLEELRVRLGVLHL